MEIKTEIKTEKMSHFIKVESFDLASEQGEHQVWQSVKQAFQGRACFVYWRYPIFFKIGKKRKELDILIVDRILGVIGIEVKSIEINQLEKIDGQNWFFQNFRDTFAAPYEQCKTACRTILSSFDQNNLLYRLVKSKAFVALPKITLAQWHEKKFNQSFDSELIYADQLDTLLSRINENPLMTEGEVFTDEQWKTMYTLLNAGDFHIKDTPFEPQLKTDTPAIKFKKKSDVIAYVNQFFHEADLAQSTIGMEIPPGVQRIRGIAGSGKTILLCQKAAIMHLKHPDWRIAFIFFTRTLYAQVISSIDRWLKHYSQGEVSYQNQKNLKVFHAWGSKEQEGFYRYLCKEHQVMPLSPNQDFKKPSEGLAYGACDLLAKRKIKELFDAIIIDEGQDLVVDPIELKFNQKQAFYWLAYESLRPVDPQDPKQKRLIWAYDEAQRLGADAIPSAREIFGEEMKDLLQGIHKGGIQKNYIMKKCYRTPGPILVMAHALGMGFLRKNGILSSITQKKEWEDIGYLVESGNFKDKDQLIRLTRPKENSPNPICEYSDQPSIEFVTYPTREEEVKALAISIQQDIELHGLNPSKNILVIVLAQETHKMIENTFAQGLINHGLNIYVACATRLNQIDPKYPDHAPNHFWMDGGVTVSRIARAKGNEAEMVYVVGLDQIAQNEADTNLRNQLFVALTRSKAWVRLSGICRYAGEYELYDEVKAVIEAGQTFEFINKPTKDISHEE